MCQKIQWKIHDSVWSVFKFEVIHETINKRKNIKKIIIIIVKISKWRVKLVLCHDGGGEQVRSPSLRFTHVEVNALVFDFFTVRRDSLGVEPTYAYSWSKFSRRDLLNALVSNHLGQNSLLNSKLSASLWPPHVLFPRTPTACASLSP